MATIDISIVVFALIIIMILDVLGIGMRMIYLNMLAFFFAIFSLGYFITNYQFVAVGNIQTIPMDLLIMTWVFLPILGSLGIMIKNR